MARYHIALSVSSQVVNVREKDFLRELIRQKELHSLRVAFVSKEGQGLQPYQMQAIWSAIQQ